MKKKTIVWILSLFLVLMLIPAFGAKAASGPVITKQPESAVVSYPAGAEFSVEVEDPESVASYQWIAEDQAGNVFVLSGVTAKTDTLFLPSTQRESGVLEFYCVITDKDGNETVSDKASLDLDNREDIRPILYVGEYALEAGQTLDLSTIDVGGQKLGKGTVAFDANATDITLTDVYFDNSNLQCDFALSANVGLSLNYYMTDQEVYNVTFVGDNEIMNTYYDYDYNAGGIPFDFYFNGDGEKPLVNFIGDGTLTITNGSNAIRVIGDLQIDVDITLRQTVKLYADGIVANNLKVSKGVKLDLEVYGSALYAKEGNLFLDGAQVTVKANAPHVSMGMATKSILQAAGEIMISGAKVDISALADPAVSNRVAGYTGLSAYGDISVYNSTINYKADVIKSDELYASNFVGISALSFYAEDSDITITIKSPDIFNVFGAYAEEDFAVVGSKVNVDVLANGPVYGIAPERDFSAEDSSVDVKAEAYLDYGDLGCYGIMCENVVIKATSPKWKVRSYAKNGMAVGCNLNDIQDDPAVFEEGYEAKNVYLRDDTDCLVPADYVINKGNVPQGEGEERYYIHVETFYDKADTSKPAQEVVFGMQGSAFEDVSEKAYYAGAVSWAVKNGITSGTSATTFSPSEPCTRAQIVTFLWRAAGSPEPESGECPFTDVNPNAYYYKAMLWAVEKGITSGTSATTFSPNDACTRAQAVAFLWRAAGSPEPQEEQNDFTDVKESAYYYKAMLWAVEYDITYGTTATTFSPDETCTRAQIVTFLYRAQ